MSRVIWKETLSFQLEDSYARCELPLPANAEILHVAEQARQICVWFSVPKDPEAPREVVYTFALVPTGGEIPASTHAPRHLGTILQDGGVFVWHIFLL